MLIMSYHLLLHKLFQIYLYLYMFYILVMIFGKHFSLLSHLISSHLPLPSTLTSQHPFSHPQNSPHSPSQEMENKIRNSMNDVYFGKTKDIVNGLRSTQRPEDAALQRNLQREIASAINKMPHHDN